MILQTRFEENEAIFWENGARFWENGARLSHFPYIYGVSYI